MNLLKALTLCVLAPYLQSSASAAPINCAAVSNDVEKAICSHPILVAQDRVISSRLDNLKQQCSSSKRLLSEGQKFWLIERWDCRNVDGAFANPDVLPSCIEERMAERIQHLSEVGASCELNNLLSTYRFVDVDYIVRFSDLYIDKRVSVFGWMDLSSCHSSSAGKTDAVLVGANGKKPRFRVKFSSMRDVDHDFLCDKTPMAHWAGTIRHDGQGNYLFLTDLLGGNL